MFELNPDYGKRDYLLPPGCKDLIDVLKLKQKTAAWKNFFDTYWKLLYETALKAGLTDGEAQEVVPDVITRAARQVREFNYDPPNGSLKAWLLLLTRWRIADTLRKRREKDAK